MGQKLNLSSNDSLLQIEDIQGEGLYIGCSCCGQQDCLYFDDIEDLPLNKIEGHYFYIYICEGCKEDIKMLEGKGIEKVSHDILWLIQRDLEEALSNLEEKSSVLKEERDTLLFDLYIDLDNKIKATKEILK